MIRALVVALVMLVTGTVAMAVRTGCSVSTPVLPQEVLTIAGERFASVLGTAYPTESGLGIEWIDPDEGALQAYSLGSLQAERYSHLRYRFQGLPRTLELALVFRTQRNPDDIQVVTIPVVSRGSTTIDLRKLPQWRGTILELGFAQYTAGQSVPPANAFRPFVLAGAELWSRSWRGAFAGQWDEWWARRNWQFMSLSALGPDSPHLHGGTPAAVVVLGLLAGVVAVAWLWRRTPRTATRMVVIVVLVGWLLLDARWMRSLHDRHLATRESYAGQDMAQRQESPPDLDLHLAAARVREALADDDRGLRVFVDAGSNFEVGRLLYHLAPLNAAPVSQVTYGTRRQRGEAVLVLFDAPDPPFDLDPHETMILDEPLRVFRLRAEQRR